MNESYYTHHEVLSRLIKYCHQDAESAMRVYERLIVGKQRSMELPDGKVTLSPRQLEELVERFSSEVGPELWTSKRGKY
ncbi:hypothetical protein [Malonomonas rubra]|uniref:hypothetical protein n=1 Tax=Malonomonas rubra TaxID=57040 RepID=UPI0026F12E69|nr:hypothetical protein [Malonomonas rubra]